MSLRLHDTLSGETRPFEPLQPDRVGVYSCGPTVYGPAHIGNFRSFLFADLLVRHLRWRGYPVTWVMNITDVDDKIIRGAAAAGETIEELGERYIATFLADAASLRMTTPDVLPRATQYIDEIVALIGTLDRARPRVPHRRRLDLLPDLIVARLRAAGPSRSRRSAGGGAGRERRVRQGRRPRLRAVEGPEAEASRHGTRRSVPGRPGWHIECSAMSMAQLGPSFDIHTGGVDLIFPHHEDEIAQSEAATGQTFVATWLHCAHLQMGGAKMAKSTGNIARVGELLAAGVSPRALRLALISVHYRAALNHSDESLAASAAAIDRLDTAVAALGSYAEDGPDDATLPAALDAAHDAFGAALDDDLNVSAALAVVFDLVRDLNRRIERRSLSTADAGRALAGLRDLDRVLAILPDPDADVDPAVAALLEARAGARLARDFAASDRLRDELADLGVTVEDTRDGQRWRRTVEAGRG